jgi:hypothetical protein
LIRQEAQGEGIASVQLDLEVRLLPVGGERPFSDDESHNVPDLEWPHPKQCNTMFSAGTEARGTIGGPQIRMSHVALKKRRVRQQRTLPVTSPSPSPPELPLGRINQQKFIDGHRPAVNCQRAVT